MSMTRPITSSASDGAEAAVVKAIDPIQLGPGIRNGACPMEGAVTLRACVRTMDAAVAASGMSMRHPRFFRRSVRAMNAAHQLAEFETGIVRDFSKTLTRTESCGHLAKAVTGGFGQQIGFFQGAETKPRLRLLSSQGVNWNAGVIRDFPEHTMMALHSVLRVTFLMMVSVVAIPMITCLLILVPVVAIAIVTRVVCIMAPGVAISIIARLGILVSVIAILIVPSLFVMALIVTIHIITRRLVAVAILALGLVTELIGAVIPGRVVRSVGFAYDLPEVKTGIVRNFAPTLPRSKSRDHFAEAMARGVRE